MGICCVIQGAQARARCQPRGVGGVGDWREVQEEGDICIPVTDSCCCMAEANPIF